MFDAAAGHAADNPEDRNWLEAIEVPTGIVGHGTNTAMQEPWFLPASCQSLNGAGLLHPWVHARPRGCGASIHHRKGHAP